MTKFITQYIEKRRKKINRIHTHKIFNKIAPKMNAVSWTFGKSCLIALAVVVALLGTSTEVAGQGLDSFPAQQQPHSLAKRMDLEMCLVRFDVHLNTIIRTEESRAMGATFLDDADVNSREQCLRLCCETENCDVFVFEEKNQGTCFLFNCGPPSNFYCKFTHHSNYTSAVLKIPTVVEPPPPQPVQPLVSQIHSLAHPQSQAAQAPTPVIVPKLSQHEMELVNLKAPKPPTRTSDQTTTTLIPPLGVQLGQMPATTTSSTPRPSTPAQCGHYEFPCHSGECIAVYNACDGIPQCADGSDEGPECRRPAAQPVPQVKPIQPIPVQQPQRPVLPPMTMEQMNPVQMPKPVFQQDLQQQELRGLQQIHNREDPMTAPKPWPRPLGEMPPSYIDTQDSRIFNHKGGLQLQSNISPPQYPDSIPDTSYIPNIPRTNQYMSLPGNYQSGPPQQQQWDPRMSPPQRPMWPQQPQMPQSIPQPIPQTNQQPQPQQPLQPVATPVVTSNDQPKTPIDTPKESDPHKAPKSSEEYETYDDQYQDGKATSGEDQEGAEKPEATQKKKQHKHRKHGDHEHEHKKKNKAKTAKKDKAHGEEHGAAAPPVHEHLKMLRNDLEIEFADHDGQAERPGGAVLSLTLGAILTAALAIMIGCRMKVARRRIRRQGGKSSYAHDADFLVNGMYL
uniref:Low-density lipoprotein receptor-related protein 11 n=1 Tax=Culex pipiens TaxID=7175 RepID=A0A8D8FP03_CULPI